MAERHSKLSSTANNERRPSLKVGTGEHRRHLEHHHPSAKESMGKQPSHEQEIARRAAHEQAVSSTEYTSQPEDKKTTELYSKENKAHAFKSIMHHARQQLSPAERSFSKLIHQPLVEKTTEILSKTIARPSGLIGAAIVACLGLLFVYSIAKFAGFPLSGSEMPLLLITGFGLGIVVEGLIKVLKKLVSKTH